MMVLILDDTKSPTVLRIMKGDKTILNKKGKDIKSLLRFVYKGTNQENVRQCIIEIQKVYMFMVGSKTTMDIKE